MSEAFARGISHGWDAANYAEAYGRTESRDDEGQRRSHFEIGAEDQAAYRRGFTVGWNRFEAGLWSDGTPVTEDDGA